MNPDQPGAAEILESLKEQLKLAGEITERQMALIDRLREERELLADIAALFEIALKETSIKLLEQDILKTAQDYESRKKKKMPGGVDMRLLK